MRTLLLAAAAAAALSLGGAQAEARTWNAQAVRGHLVSPDEDRDAFGKFRMLVVQRGEARREYLYVDAWALDAAQDAEGNLPDYHVFCVTADGATAADFGEAYLSRMGRLKLRFHSARQPFPEGVRSLLEFGGGKVEVRLGDVVVLAGRVPEFVEIGDDNEPGSGAWARAAGLVRLHATEEGGRAKGLLWALAVNRPALSVEALMVTCWRLGDRGESFDVVCTDATGAETTLGSFTVRSRARIGVLHLSTRQGDTIPGGGVLALGGQTVEVRDGEGTVHLTGTFPDLAGE